MKITINDYFYHVNRLDEITLSFANKVIRKLFRISPTLNDFVKQNFSKYNYKYTKQEKLDLLKKIILAISFELKQIKDDYEEDEFYALLLKNIHKVLPIILTNEKSCYYNSCFLYQPTCVYTLYLLNQLYDYLSEYIDENENLEINEVYQLVLILQIVRACRTSLLCFANGDDVHGISICRGAIELSARGVNLNENNIDDFIKFNKINAELQLYKINKSDLKNYPELEKFLQERPYSRNGKETYLLNGWCKNKNGKRIQSTADMIRQAFGNGFVKIYNFASEFVHEDYLNTIYNYEWLRFNMTKMIAYFTVILFGINLSTLQVVSKKDNATYQNLLECLDKKLIDEFLAEL